MDILKKIFSFVKIPAILAGMITFVYWLFIMKAIREGLYLPGIPLALTIVFFSWFALIMTFEIVFLIIWKLFVNQKKKVQSKKREISINKPFYEMSREEYEEYFETPH
ncbi:MAG: hypothetical protein WCW84_06785 [Sulfurimonas sp.]|jgi:hypothetical protein